MRRGLFVAQAWHFSGRRGFLSARCGLESGRGDTLPSHESHDGMTRGHAGVNRPEAQRAHTYGGVMVSCHRPLPWTVGDSPSDRTDRSRGQRSVARQSAMPVGATRRARCATRRCGLAGGWASVEPRGWATWPADCQANLLACERARPRSIFAFEHNSPGRSKTAESTDCRPLVGSRIGPRDWRQT